ncbi:hypothetical protein ACFO3U_08290 [Flavobacterium ponti]|uniref:DUF91 domain-containing protein n=1 Tax=Flavobacterium ponti TaxID=665133 RepID=A0ABV9P5K8_9FLAO
MNIKEIANKINSTAFSEKRSISKLQEIRSKHLKSRPNTWNLFSEKSVKERENYAFHAGGRNEFQFNIGNDYVKNKDVFRYGLAFSLEKGPGMYYPLEVFEPKIKKFNDFVKSKTTFFDGYFMWIYSSNGKVTFFEQVIPINKNFIKEGNFIFIGKYIEKTITAIDNDDINELLNSFDYLIEVYKKVEFGNNEVEKRIARLTWNENGWVKPSGPEGKSKNKDTHEGQFGYGHEEWLLDISKLVDGYHYGFLEPIRKQQQAYINNIYDVWLYTIDNISKKRYWVGEINKIEVIDNAEAERIKEIYVQNKWHQEMESQIIDCDANADGFSDWNGVDLFNVRFLPTDLKFNSDYFELPKENKIYEQSRYSFANYNEGLTPIKAEKGFIFNSDIENKEGNNDTSKIGTATYAREPKAIEVTYVHKAICDGIKVKFVEQFGYENVSTENHAGYGNNRIDMVVKNNNEYVFYEIKAYNSSRASIREALGQLLEYSYWINKDNANKLVIVSQKLGDLDDSKIYIKHLREKFQLPIYFQTFDLTTKELSEEY